MLATRVRQGVDRQEQRRYSLRVAEKISEDLKMQTYQVTYDVGGDIRSALIEASGPVEATRLFLEQNRSEYPVVLCVVRQ
jgi:hypothetical protein